MSRVFITLDETNPNFPVPELNVNGGAIRLSYRELDLLAEEVKWIQGAIAGIRSGYWEGLASKYRQQAEAGKGTKP